MVFGIYGLACVCSALLIVPNIIFTELLGYLFSLSSTCSEIDLP